MVFIIIGIIYLAFELKKYLVDTILNALIFILGTLALHKGLSMVIEDAQMVGKICVGTKLIEHDVYINFFGIDKNKIFGK